MPQLLQLQGHQLTLLLNMGVHQDTGLGAVAVHVPHMSVRPPVLWELIFIREMKWTAGNDKS